MIDAQTGQVQFRSFRLRDLSGMFAMMRRRSGDDLRNFRFDTAGSAEYRRGNLPPGRIPT